MSAHPLCAPPSSGRLLRALWGIPALLLRFLRQCALELLGEPGIRLCDERANGGRIVVLRLLVPEPAAVTAEVVVRVAVRPSCGSEDVRHRVEGDLRNMSRMHDVSHAVRSLTREVRAHGEEVRVRLSVWVNDAHAASLGGCLPITPEYVPIGYPRTIKIAIMNEVQES